MLDDGNLSDPQHHFTLETTFKETLKMKSCKKKMIPPEEEVAGTNSNADGGLNDLWIGTIAEEEETEVKQILYSGAEIQYKGSVYSPVYRKSPKAQLSLTR